MATKPKMGKQKPEKKKTDDATQTGAARNGESEIPPVVAPATQPIVAVVEEVSTAEPPKAPERKFAAIGRDCWRQYNDRFVFGGQVGAPCCYFTLPKARQVADTLGRPILPEELRLLVFLDNDENPTCACGKCGTFPAVRWAHVDGKLLEMIATLKEGETLEKIASSIEYRGVFYVVGNKALPFRGPPFRVNDRSATLEGSAYRDHHSCLGIAFDAYNNDRNRGQARQDNRKREETSPEEPNLQHRHRRFRWGVDAKTRDQILGKREEKARDQEDRTAGIAAALGGGRR